MPRQMNLNVRVSGELSDFVSQRTGPDGTYDNTSEYIRDLIRRDKQASEAAVSSKRKPICGNCSGLLNASLQAWRCAAQFLPNSRLMATSSIMVIISSTGVNCRVKALKLPPFCMNGCTR